MCNINIDAISKYGREMSGDRTRTYNNNRENPREASGFQPFFWGAEEGLNLEFKIENWICSRHMLGQHNYTIVLRNIPHLGCRWLGRSQISRRNHADREQISGHGKPPRDQISGVWQRFRPEIYSIMDQMWKSQPLNHSQFPQKALSTQLGCVWAGSPPQSRKLQFLNF